MAGMVDARWVRIMCEYGADPVWGPDGAMNYLDDLPVTPGLRARLRAWEDQFDGREPPEAPWPADDLAAFSNYGRDLAREVKRQLPDWTVIYFDEEALANASADAPRETYEYPIPWGGIASAR